MATSYYARRSARDPDWHAQQLRGAHERFRLRRELDPEGVRVSNRESTKRYRENARAHGLTFAQLHARIGGDPAQLALVLRDEVARGHVDLKARHYVLNGGLDPDVVLALRDLRVE